MERFQAPKNVGWEDYQVIKHSCYVEEDADTPCWSLSDDEYENIKKYKDYAENLYEMEITIDCSAKILTYAFSILAIFALLLW